MRTSCSAWRSVPPCSKLSMICRTVGFNLGHPRSRSLVQLLVKRYAMGQVNELAMPQLEHKECPQLSGMIAPLTLVFIQQHVDVAGLDIPTLHRARFSKDFATALAQLPVD